MKKVTIAYPKIALLAFVLVSILFFISSCTSTNEPAANEVFIQGMAFSPATLTVTAGTTVKWTNKDGVAHTVTCDTGLFDSGNVGANGTYSHAFTTAGTYNYHCTYHSSMTAKVVVN
ncbi:MAG: cupredoxin domain-containing protein [Paludibacter sp.]|nr:cupredoxin domain-containing protein [Paludibacter sp.]